MPALLVSLLLPTLAVGAGAAIAYLFAATIASGLIAIGGTILGWMAMLFDTFMYYTVVAFNTFIYAAVEEGVKTAWTVGRDIANIVIIGMFVFVAIMTILGNAEYGAKRLVARVLIIAVLINFSLLFTQAIIQSSNFVSAKFYYALVPQETQQATQQASSGVTSYFNSQYGIAGRFMTLAGLNSILNAKETTQKIRDENEYGFWMTLLYGMSVFILCMAFAGVLGYAIILLAARTILFIILLITSSLAFGSHLIPKVSDNYGWSLWWGSLLRNAVFAPLLLIMLWATFQVGDAFVRTSGSTRSFDKLFLGQADGSGVLALLFFIIILGMLFASIRIASMFAAKIPGFNWAAVVPAFGAAILARAAAIAGRQTVGRAGMRIGASLQEASKDQAKPLWARQLYDFGAQRFKEIGKKEMNPLRGAVGGELQRLTGLKADTLTGKAIKGFEATEKERAKQFAAQAERMKLDGKETEELAGKAIAQIIKENPTLGQQHNESKKAANDADSRVKELEKAQAQAIDRFAQTLKESTRNLEQAQKSGAASTEIERLEKEIQRQRADHQAAMNSEKRRIDDAKLIATSARRQETQTKEQLLTLAKERGLFPKEVKDVANLAKDITHRRFSNTLARAVGWSTEDNDALAKAAAKQIGENKKKKDAKSVADVLKTFSGDDHAPKKEEEGSKPNH